MIRTFAFLYLVVIPFFVFAKYVESDRALKVAKQFYQKQYYRFNYEIKNISIKDVHSYFINNRLACYIIRINPNGFVITSADDNAFPIIGYSFNEDIIPQQLPESMKNYLDLASEQILKARELKKSYYNDIWLKIENEPLTKTTLSSNAISPFLNLYWDQGVPYNNYCPPSSHGPGGHCVTGCVATAMAMTMKYYNYPEHGKGEKTFIWSDIDTIDYENTYYRWSEMTSYANSQSGDAIAELMYHCGVAVNMNYGPDGSSSYTEWVPDAMKDYFRYHPSIRFKDRSKFTDYDWDILIRDQLNLKRPVIYSGSGTGGHAFVCDGYQDTCFYHFNWGWSGYANGYYYYNDLTPGSNDFSYGQGAVINIMPYFADYCNQDNILIDTTRTLEDGSGLSYYWNNTHCSWLIKPRGASQIKLNFTNFNTETNYDVLSIYDGETDQAPLIGSFSGNQLPSEILSTGNALFLTFNTNDTIQGQGWELYYTSIFVGIEPINLENQFQLFPNPVNNYLTITSKSNENYTIHIYNVLGEKVYSQTTKNDLLINTASLNNGLYLIEISQQYQKIRKKFIVKH
ncbi:MAG: C10 family peptidase [Bacteroidales bacterium]|nr:C10 family peptidase [Bacteroidales bacterium]